MRQTWRWFGPVDRTSLSDVRQAGAEGIVTALHDHAPGRVWSADAIASRQREVSVANDGSSAGLAWEVVESLPVSEAIKTKSGPWREHLTAYKDSLTNLAEAGIQTICYNFMPVIDWTRTDLAAPMPHGGTAMRFDVFDFAAFDLHILERPAAREEFSEPIRAEARRRHDAMDDAAKSKLASNITAGLPGAAEHWTLSSLREKLEDYAKVDAQGLRNNYIDFLSEIIPHAQRLQMRMCCHPDDPPFPLLGLPRVMSTAEDFETILAAVDSPANGLTFCTGSLGARADNDIPAMVRRFAPRIHFAHLRNVTRDDDGLPCSFFEDEHLGGQTDMIAVLQAFLDEEARRRDSGREDHQIPMRPDHGQDILDDIGRGAQPGYPAVGRLKGLAELRGAMKALESVAGARVGAGASREAVGAALES